MIEPGGRIRAFGVPTRNLEDVVTDATRVLWQANGCLLVAPVTEPAATAPGAGPCARAELELPGRPNPKLRRTLHVRLRCVAAPGRCRGTLQLRASRPGRSPSASAVRAGLRCG